MASSGPRFTTPTVSAMVCSGLIGAQFVAGKATRDALFLDSLDVTSLPAMFMATAAVSMLLVALSSWVLRYVTPRVFVPSAFAVSALLLMLEWLLTRSAPTLAAQAVYLQISGLGPILGSGFWLITTERFDPRSARRQFGQIAGVGTLGGLIGALAAERVAAVFDVSAMLPVLALLNIVCAWQVRGIVGLPGQRPGVKRAPDGELMVASPRSGLRVLADTPYLRNLAALVLLGTIGAALADYVFKVQAVDALGRGDGLLRFFALYYAATSLLTFLLQTTSTARTLERLGLAAAISTPSLALLAGGAGAVLFPGLGTMTLARGSESVFRGSLFKTGYEISFTPVPAEEKRAAKSIIDVGFDRVGDLIGGGLVQLLILLPVARQTVAILGTALACATLTLVAGRRLNRGYVQTLERSLVNRAVELDLAEVEDLTTRTVMMQTLRTVRDGAWPLSPGVPALSPTPSELAAADADIRDILALRSRDRDRVLGVLRADTPLSSTLVPHVIPLLAWDPVADPAMQALRRVADACVGSLIDTLVDPAQPFAVRRRLARVFSACSSQRAVDGLVLGLDDPRFEVRFQCGRSISVILDRSPSLRIEAPRVFDVVRREVRVGRPVWESHRLLDGLDDTGRSFVDELVKDRAGQSLAHVFLLLSLVLPRVPLQIAFRGLHTDDPALRGTALEYLDGVLPPDIRQHLWPFVDSGPNRAAQARPRQDILADLLRSNESIQMNLDELRRRGTHVSTRPVNS